MTLYVCAFRVSEGDASEDSSDSDSDDSDDSDASLARWLATIDHTFLDDDGPGPKKKAKAKAKAAALVSENSSDDDPEPWMRFKVGTVGTLVLNNKGSNFSLAAHCKKHGALCRVNRTLKEKGGQYRGRPVGFLIAWLQAAGDFKGKSAHIKAGKDPKKDQWTRQKRKDARLWANTQEPLVVGPLSYERKPRDEETDGEPLECPD